MKVLDLFCGAGGASMGYFHAGYEVIGVGINDQPHYPFEFVRDDAIHFATLHADEFDLVHASPPCQRFSRMTRRWGTQDNHPDLIGKVRDILRKENVPFIIENVVGSPLENPVLFCGSMFPELNVRRHRLFESTLTLTQLQCKHADQGRVVGVYGNPGGSSKRDKIRFGSFEDWKKAMGISWMTAKELKEAIPPRYTQEIGTQLSARLALRQRSNTL